MDVLDEFIKACPVGLCLHERCVLGHPYKYFACGKGCVLGILFEDSLHVYFEWVAEDGRLTAYGPELRYKFWPKREFARLLAEGVWEAPPMHPRWRPERGRGSKKGWASGRMRLLFSPGCGLGAGGSVTCGH